MHVSNIRALRTSVRCTESFRRKTRTRWHLRTWRLCSAPQCSIPRCCNSGQWRRNSGFGSEPTKSRHKRQYFSFSWSWRQTTLRCCRRRSTREHGRISAEKYSKCFDLSPCIKRAFSHINTSVGGYVGEFLSFSFVKPRKRQISAAGLVLNEDWLHLVVCS